MVRSSEEKRLQLNHFEKVASKYMHRYRSLYWVLYLKVFKKWFLSLNHQMSLLDLGCGTGHLSCEIADYVDYVVGLDISHSMICEVKKRRVPKNVDFIVGDAENLPVHTACFEIVVVSGLLHHMENLEKCLLEISRILKMGGTFFALEPNKEAFQGSVAFYEMFFPPLRIILPLWKKFNRDKFPSERVARHGGMMFLSPIFLNKLLLYNRMKPRIWTMMFPVIPFRVLRGRYNSAMAKMVLLVNVFLTKIFDVLPMSRHRGYFLVIESDKQGRI